MPWHHWGGEFNFDKLDKAGRYLSKLYKRITGKHMIWKEKYGTIRYEFLRAWIETDQDAIIFDKCLRRCIRKFPDVAGELVDDICFQWAKPELEYFYKGIVYLHDALSKDDEYDQF